MKNPVITIQSCVITTITTIIYALLAPVLFEMDNAFGGENLVNHDNDKMTMLSQQVVVETECKSPCPSSAEICIAMCA